MNLIPASIKASTAAAITITHEIMFHAFLIVSASQCSFLITFRIIKTEGYISVTFGKITEKKLKLYIDIFLSAILLLIHKLPTIFLGNVSKYRLMPTIKRGKKV